VLVSEPFVLISGDVICNVDLVEVIDQHKRRRKKDKECIMTMIFKQAPSTCRTRSLGDDLVVALDGKDNRILKYLDNTSESNVEFDVPCFKDHTSVQFRYDLLDCNVDVCSLSMVDRIADEYDVQDLRKHFITREVADRELGLKIHGHVVTHQYAARVFDPRTYDSIASDVVRRWAYPFTIDSNFLNFGTSSFVCSRGNRYKESGVQVGTNTIVGPNTVVGSDTTIGDHVSIQASTFGSNCTIGNGAKIQGSHLWNNVTVGENATIDRAIVCEGVVVRKGATVSRGCVLSFGVVIDEGVFVPEFTRLTRVPRQLVQRRVSALEGWDDTYGESDEDEGNTEAGSGEFDWNQLLADMVRCEHVEVNTWKGSLRCSLRCSMKCSSTELQVCTIVEILICCWFGCYAGAGNGFRCGGSQWCWTSVGPKRRRRRGRRRGEVDRTKNHDCPEHGRGGTGRSRGTTMERLGPSGGRRIGGNKSFVALGVHGWLGTGRGRECGGWWCWWW